MSDWWPSAGEVIWVDFSPTVGTEQSGRRPALVISEEDFNRRSGRAVVLPITSKYRPFPFQVSLPPEAPVAGAVLVDQVRTIDWRARFAKPAGAAPAELLDEVRARLAPVLGLSIGPA